MAGKIVNREMVMKVSKMAFCAAKYLKAGIGIMEAAPRAHKRESELSKMLNPACWRVSAIGF